jgi:hypothetical protein
VLLGHTHSLQNLSVNFLGFNINYVHFLSNALQRRLGAQRSHVRSDKSMGIFSHRLQINIFGQLHILSMNSQYFQSANLIWHSNINFPIKSTESPECRI